MPILSSSLPVGEQVTAPRIPGLGNAPDAEPPQPREALSDRLDAAEVNLRDDLGPSAGPLDLADVVVSSLFDFLVEMAVSS